MQLAVHAGMIYNKLKHIVPPVLLPSSRWLSGAAAAQVTVCAHPGQRAGGSEALQWPTPLFMYLMS